MKKEQLMRLSRCVLFAFPVLVVACGSGTDAVASPDAAPPAACKSGIVTADCMCGKTLVSSGFCCGDTPQSNACATNPGACANGLVPAACTCGTTQVSSGYCCEGVPKTISCTAPAACANGQVTGACTCGTTQVSSGYCCEGVPKTISCTAPAACANGQVTGACTCGTTQVSSGYCCEGVHQSNACAALTPQKSAGCGSAVTGTSGLEARTLNNLTYYVKIPKPYDANKAYALVFYFHGSGGDGKSDGIGIPSDAYGDAIFVGPNDENLTSFDSLLAEIEKTMCVDTRRIFVSGFSMGGLFSEELGCKRASVVRAIAPVAGRGKTGCSGKVAALFLHGTQDSVVSIDDDMSARDELLSRNGCVKSQTAPYQHVATGSPTPTCVSYACPAEYPVVWCTVDIGHNPLNQIAAPERWHFFNSLPALP